jgi:hypothetical protein
VAAAPHNAERRETDGTRPKVDVGRGGEEMRAAEAAAEEWGVLTTDELLSCGFSREAIKRRARNGRLHRIHHRV